MTEKNFKLNLSKDSEISKSEVKLETKTNLEVKEIKETKSEDILVINKNDTDKCLRVRVIQTGCFMMVGEGKYCNMPWKQMLQMFLPPTFNYKIVPVDENADLCLFSIGLADESLLRDQEVNIMICIENCSQWWWYPHYKKYGNYGNKKIDIYLYNHISKLSYGENNKYLVVPTMYPRITYFSMIENYYYNHKSLNCDFKEKKFCLTINRSTLNQDINSFVQILEDLGHVDNLSLYTDKIKGVSCYNPIELLEVFNKYKFIVTFENSYNDGYITEKIFNVFLAKSIPLYAGSKLAESIFNPNSFININPSDLNKYIIDRIEYLCVHEDRYNEMINEPKLNNKFNNDDYINHMTSFINNKLKLT